MPAKRTKRPLRKRTPARVKTRTRKPKRAHASHQHPELVGLALVATGLFLASVLYLGWDGGVGGRALVDGVARSSATRVRPPAGAREPRRAHALPQLHDRRPSVPPWADGPRDRLLLVLGKAHGGKLGEATDTVMGRLLGRTGVVILGVLGILVGTLVLSNLSLGAWLRRSHAAARTMRARRPKRTRTPARAPEPLIAEPVAIAAALAPPIDAVADYADALHDEAPTDPVSVTPPLLPEREPLDEDPPTLFDLEPLSAHSDYTLPDRNVLRVSPGEDGLSPEANAARRRRCSSRRSRTSASTRR